MVYIPCRTVCDVPKAVQTVGSCSSPAEIAQVLGEDGCVVIADLAPLETMDQIRAEHFSEELGATRMVVGSRRWEDDPDDVDAALSSLGS